MQGSAEKRDTDLEDVWRLEVEGGGGGWGVIIAIFSHEF